MQVATIEEIRTALFDLNPRQLQKLCLRMTKFKLENKELLTYLLFHEENEDEYRQMILDHLTYEFHKANFDYVYFAKRSLWRIVKYLEKAINITSSKETEVDLRIFFIHLMKKHKLQIYQSEAIYNVLTKQIRLIHEAIEKLHEDLQHDYREELSENLHNYYKPNYYSLLH